MAFEDCDAFDAVVPDCFEATTEDEPAELEDEFEVFVELEDEFDAELDELVEDEAELDDDPLAELT